VRAATSIAGVDEWSIRLPALAFGVATVPAVYALARVALRSREAILAALILATSYSHVSFSQNSRGYAAFVFWTAVATWLLLRALAGDRGRDWWGFALASFLACATVVLGGFTLAGQAAALLLVAAAVRRAGGRPWPIVLKGVAVIGAVGLALFDLYAIALPGLYRHVRPVEAEPMVQLPNPFWNNLGRGLGQAFGDAGMVALLVLAVLLAPGMLRFVRRHPITCAHLAVPVATLGAGVVLLHLFAAPRYFLWAVVPFSIGVVGSAALWPHAPRWAAPVMAGLVVAGSMVGLKDYYQVPLQASRESVEWILEESAPEDIVVPVTAAQPLAQFYGRPLGLFRARTVHMASSAEDLQSVDRIYAGRRVWLITTARRPLVQFHRDMMEYIDRCYEPVRSFPAKIHGMQITVWRGGCGSGSVAGARPPP
jgi:4-amino-4-deoxy-L-arabinose transferase-like glycosyltransferase